MAGGYGDHAPRFPLVQEHAHGTLDPLAESHHGVRVQVPARFDVEGLEQLVYLPLHVGMFECLSYVEPPGAVGAEREGVEPPLPEFLARASLRALERAHSREPHRQVLWDGRVGGCDVLVSIGALLGARSPATGVDGRAGFTGENRARRDERVCELSRSGFGTHRILYGPRVRVHVARRGEAHKASRILQDGQKDGQGGSKQPPADPRPQERPLRGAET